MSTFTELKSEEIIPGMLTCYIPGRGNDLQLLEKITGARNESLVFMGAGNSEKSALWERSFTMAASNQSTSIPAEAVLASLQSLCGIQQPNLDESYRAASVLSCLYGEDGSYIGAHISVLAQEFLRVAKSSETESNYLAFYDLLRYAPSELKSTLHLSDLKEINKAHLDWANQERFEKFNAAFDFLQDGLELKASFYRILAAILHLRELKIEESDSDVPVEIGNLEVVEALLDLPAKSILSTLGMRKLTSGRRASGVIEGHNSISQTQKYRDVLIVQLYRSAVMWLFHQLNKHVAAREGEAKTFLNLFNIPSPESFQTSPTTTAYNGTNQLCRNYLDENVMSCLKLSLFEKERAFLASEGMSNLWSNVALPSNTEVLQLLNQPVKGIIPQLDVQTQLGDASSDKGYLSQIRISWGTTPVFHKPRFGEDDGFVVKHYFGSVNYTAAGFIEANNETVHKTFANFPGLLKKSGNGVLKDVFVHNCLQRVVVEEGEGWMKSQLSRSVADTLGGSVA